jgi:hypothetical protein
MKQPKLYSVTPIPNTVREIKHTFAFTQPVEYSFNGTGHAFSLCVNFMHFMQRTHNNLFKPPDTLRRNNWLFI